MATEILVNDGGAPARILPFTAGSTIAAGEPVIMATTDGEVDSVAAAASGTMALGVSLTWTLHDAGQGRPTALALEAGTGDPRLAKVLLL
jgi:hypothetical protein